MFKSNFQGDMGAQRQMRMFSSHSGKREMPVSSDWQFS